ncbi:MAG: alpha/beta fold hydrolase [Pseudomonas sp.]|jgi:pimeloyl-[acyl-carrier protein] methyl ester esterase|nr:alpha/beta fold hydrolase [Pseudomonas sp.]
MNKRIIILPGWGLGVLPLQLLAEELDASLPDFTVQIQPLPDMTGQTAAAVIKQLDQQLPNDCWLLGWSLGGMLATALAAHRQSACAGLISYASNACFVARDTWPLAMPMDTFSAFRQLCRSDLPAGLKRFALLCSQGAAQPRLLSRQLQDMPLATELASALAGLDLLAALDNREAIRAFAGPQLHVLAHADALLPSEAANLLGDLNPRATVELLGHSHASVLSEPQLLAQRMVSFILDRQYA